MDAAFDEGRAFYWRLTTDGWRLTLAVLGLATYNQKRTGCFESVP
jgi:hypothetical protein